MMDVLVVPRRALSACSPAARSIRKELSITVRSRRRARIPGYYRVLLKDHGIEAELTATARAGLHRYRFGQPGAGHLLIDLTHGLSGICRSADQDHRRIPACRRR